MGIVIVALPEESDAVYKYSSEKIPHMTLLYLGDGPIQNEENVIGYIQHVAKTSLHKFGMTVNRRDTLGPNDADVLYFEKGWENKDIEHVRSHLLKNDDIKAMYDTAEQFEGWVPHLTMGFPDSPAKPDDREHSGFNYVQFDRIAIWLEDYDGPEFRLESAFHDIMNSSTYMSDTEGEDLEHAGVKGMRWGVKKDERDLDIRDQALNLSQRSQVKIANTISTLAAVGLSTNAAAAAFQLQSRWEHLQVVKTLIDQAENNPLIGDAAREGLRTTKQKVVRGLVASAAMTTAITFAIGAVTTRTAKAYFAPLHKAYGDVKPRINGDLKKLSRDIKKGNRAKLNAKDYHAEVAKIVKKRLTEDKSNILSPFHELARSQLGTEYNTKQLNIKFEKLPNTDLFDKMTVTTPNGLKLVKAIKNVEHADSDNPDIGDVDIFFDYEFDEEGYVVEWSSPTIEIAIDMFDGTFDLDSVASKFGEESKLTHSEGEALAHLSFDDIKGAAKSATKKVKEAKGNFDESSVKRDVSGQFAKIAGSAADLLKEAEEFGIDTSKYTKEQIAEMVSAFKNLNILGTKTTTSGTVTKSGPGKNGYDWETRRPGGPLISRDRTKGNSTLKQSALEELLHDVLGKNEVKEVDTRDLIDTILEHSGVKGMRWGYRRATNAAGLVVGSVPKNPTGPGPDASADHLRTTLALSGTKGSGLAALTTQEVRDVTARIKALDELDKALNPAQKSEIQTKVENLRLEADLRRLTAEQRAANQGPGKKLAKALMANGGQLIVKGLAEEIGINSKNLFAEALGNNKAAKDKAAKEKLEKLREKIEEERRQDIRKEQNDIRSERRKAQQKANENREKEHLAYQARRQEQYDKAAKAAEDEAKERAKKAKKQGKDGYFVL